VDERTARLHLARERRTVDVLHACDEELARELFDVFETCAPRNARARVALVLCSLFVRRIEDNRIVLHRPRAELVYFCCDFVARDKASGVLLLRSHEGSYG